MSDDTRPAATAAVIPPDTLTALQTKHGADAVHVIGEGARAMVFRTPTRAAWRAFKALSMDPGRRASAPEKLVSDCLLWPDMATADGIFDRAPALVDVYASDLCDFAAGAEGPLPSR